MSRETWLQSLKAGNPVWRQNLLGSRATPDQMLLSKTAEKSNLLRDISTKGQLAQLDDDLLFLRGQSTNPRPNLFHAPRDINEAALQRGVQDDINARVAGLNVGYASELDNRKRAFENMEQAFKMQDQGIQLGNAQRGWKQFDLSMDRERRIAGDQDRLRSRQEQEFGINAARTQDKLLFDRAQAMLDAGVPAAQIFRAMPGMSPELRRQVAMIEQGYSTMENQGFGLLQQQSENQNRALRLAEEEAADRYRQQNEANFFGAGGPTPEGEAEARERARRQFLDDLFKSKDVRENIMFDPATGTFKPFAVPPRTAMLAPPQSGSGSPTTTPARSSQPEPIQVRSAQDAMRLPSGTAFRRPDGVVMIRP